MWHTSNLVWVLPCLTVPYDPTALFAAPTPVTAQPHRFLFFEIWISLWVALSTEQGCLACCHKIWCCWPNCIVLQEVSQALIDGSAIDFSLHVAATALCTAHNLNVCMFSTMLCTAHSCSSACQCWPRSWPKPWYWKHIGKYFGTPFFCIIQVGRPSFATSYELPDKIFLLW